MANAVGPRQMEAWNTFKTGVLAVMEARGMNRNELAKAATKKKLASAKTVYNVLEQKHPPKLSSWLAIAESLDLPLWLLLIPDLPRELIDGPGREEFLRTVRNYIDCDLTARSHIANTAASHGDICRAKKPKP